MPANPSHVTRCFTLFLCCIAPVTGWSMRVGQTRAAIVEQHGIAIEENHARSTAIYRAGSWKVDVTYDSDIAKVIVFTKTDTLTEDDIAAILAQNASGAEWRELQMATNKRIWQRSDLATAECDRVKPRSLRVINSPLPRTAPHSTATANPVTTRTQAVPAAASQVTVAPPVPPSGTPIFVLVTVVGIISGAVKVFRRNRKAGSRSKSPHTRPLAPCPKKSTRFAQLPPLPPPVQIVANIKTAYVPTLDSMGWENFELLCGEIFRRKGYAVEITAGLGADGGKDLTLRKDGQLVVVQCKNLAQEKRVTASQMRDFFGLITAEGAAIGFFVTTGYFSADAKRFAAGKPIELLERSDVEKLVTEVSAPGENLCNVSSWIDTFATRACVVDPVCPFCEHPMKLRRGALGRLFWGCIRYATHRCKGRRDGRQELLQARQ